MSVFEALVLGLVQGITEFVPVSSSGHLVLLQRIFGIEEASLVFGTAVHGGTLVAVFVVFWRDIGKILRRPFQPLTLHLIIGTLPAVMVVLLFRPRIEEAFATGSFLGFAFLITSGLLLVSDGLYRSRGSPGGFPEKVENPSPIRYQDEMNILDSLIIGLLQAAAIFPGISRSGATISGGLARKLDRDLAARFSFLLSIPAILGALVLQGRDLLSFGQLSGGLLSDGAGYAGSIGFLPLAVGTISAGVVGFFSIRLVLIMVRERSLILFALYTGILGVLILVDQFGTQLYF